MPTFTKKSLLKGRDADDDAKRRELYLRSLNSRLLAVEDRPSATSSVVSESTTIITENAGIRAGANDYIETWLNPAIYDYLSLGPDPQPDDVDFVEFALAAFEGQANFVLLDANVYFKVGIPPSAGFFQCKVGPSLQDPNGVEAGDFIQTFETPTSGWPSRLDPTKGDKWRFVLGINTGVSAYIRSSFNPAFTTPAVHLWIRYALIQAEP